MKSMTSAQSRTACNKPVFERSGCHAYSVSSFSLCTVKRFIRPPRKALPLHSLYELRADRPNTDGNSDRFPDGIDL